MSATTYGMGLRRTVSATVQQLRLSDRTDRAKRILREWSFRAESDRIPLRYPTELWPGIEAIEAHVPLDHTYTYELPLGERALIDGLVRYARPKLLFEFGTFTGATTALLSHAASAEATVHTIDLPAEAFPAGGFDGWFTSDLVGAKCAEIDNVIVHRADLRSFDFDPFRGKVDFLLCDADHAYESVVHDSAIAFDLLAPGGQILWDDYSSDHWGVVRALNEIAQSRVLVRVADTRLVVSGGV